MEGLSAAEITGFLFGIGGIWLTIKKNSWCFPVGLVNVTITAWLVWKQHLYADLLQQVVYFILLVYGWWKWTTAAKENERQISRTDMEQGIIISIIFLCGSLIMGFLLKRYTDASYPYLDSTGTSICFIAQWMIAVKKLENWYLWVVANIMYIIIYYLKDLPLYAVLSGVYLILSFAGLREWKKILSLQTP